MVELLQRDREKPTSRTRHAWSIEESLSEVSDRALSNFGNLEQCRPIMHDGYD